VSQRDRGSERQRDKKKGRQRVRVKHAAFIFGTIQTRLGKVRLG
jgi:hypothetical protein